MMKRYYPLMVAVALVSLLFLGIALLRPSQAKSSATPAIPDHGSGRR